MTDLLNKPLVEAILELKWRGDGVPDNAAFVATGPDPEYRVLLARMQDRLAARFPAHEPQPAANVPDGMVAHIAQHRFRAAANSWPLFQLGPGLLTLNQTHAYKWAEYETLAYDVVTELVASHPRASTTRLEHVALRYIDAIPFPASGASVIEFLGSKLHLGVSLPDSLFADGSVDPNPKAFQWQMEFASSKPVGFVSMKLGLGAKEGESALLLDTSVTSRGQSLKEFQGSFKPWLTDAHLLCKQWFERLVEGELYESFKPVG